MDDCVEVSEHDNAFEVVDVRKLASFFDINDSLNEETVLFNMTSLGTFMLLNQSESKSSPDPDQYNECEKYRLSLAYEKLHTIPKLLLQELSLHIRILDISNNEFDNLDFLSEFKQLTSLICDHNNITSSTKLPYMPKLDLLWLNHCKVSELYPWARKLQQSCPNLRFLSLMGNPAAPSYLNGGNIYEYIHYRLFMISLFPKLVHLDDKIVTDDQIEEAHRMYKRPLIERIVSRSPSNLPTYLRSVSDKFSEMFTQAPPFAAPQKNIII